MKKLHIKIVTPQSKYYEDNAYYVSVPGKNGSLGFLPGHMPYFSILVEGNIVISDTANSKDPNSKKFKVSSGYVNIMDDSVLILAEKIEEKN